MGCTGFPVPPLSGQFGVVELAFFLLPNTHPVALNDS